MNVARLELQYWGMLLKLRRQAPVPQSPILRSIVGLPERASKDDGERVRTLLEEKPAKD